MRQQGNCGTNREPKRRAVCYCASVLGSPPPPTWRCSSLWDRCAGLIVAMDTSTRKFTVRRWFSIYLKNKAARNKNSAGFCQLEVSRSINWAFFLRSDQTREACTCESSCITIGICVCVLGVCTDVWSWTGNIPKHKHRQLTHSSLVWKVLQNYSESSASFCPSLCLPRTKAWGPQEMCFGRQRVCEAGCRTHCHTGKHKAEAGRLVNTWI